MRYYFIGIKGTGMAALACMLHDLGHEVSGSDLEKHFFTEDELVKRNIPIYPFHTANIKDGMHVIIGNAFLDDFDEVVAARANTTCVCYRYHEFVGKFIESYKTVAVAGSHGKTTTTGMLSNVLAKKGNTGYLIGDGSGHVCKDTEYFCLESCEFRRHFLKYFPEYAIITNAEIDHVDYFKDEKDYRSAYEEFSYNVSKGIVCFGDDEQTRLLKLNPNIPCLYYGLKEEDELQAIHVVEDCDHTSFDILYHKQEMGHFDLPFVGHHLLLDALAVIGIGLLEGICVKDIEDGLRAFHGVKRRFQVEMHEDNIFIDDYAHHPTEVSVTIDTARKRFPNRKLVAIFKPHRASRVMYFAKEFKEALEKADSIYLCDFTSIDDKQDGCDIDITYLQSMIEGSKILEENEAGAAILAKEKPAVFLFMSSKDIYWLAEMVKRSQ